MPPANLDERPPDPPESNDEDSDEDDFGPALPSAATNGSSEVKDTKSIPPSAARTPAPKTARDEWLLVPPSSGDWTSRVDPTKLKSRTFNTGKSAKGIPQATDHDNAKWTETPAEKKARLEREMMGIQEKPMPKIGSQQDRASEATARKLKEYTVCLMVLRSQINADMVDSRRNRGVKHFLQSISDGLRSRKRTTPVPEPLTVRKT